MQKTISNETEIVKSSHMLTLKQEKILEMI